MNKDVGTLPFFVACMTFTLLMVLANSWIY
jgi:hypothetical protein